MLNATIASLTEPEVARTLQKLRAASFRVTFGVSAGGSGGGSGAAYQPPSEAELVWYEVAARLNGMRIDSAVSKVGVIERSMPAAKRAAKEAQIMELVRRTASRMCFRQTHTTDAHYTHTHTHTHTHTCSIRHSPGTMHSAS